MINDTKPWLQHGGIGHGEPVVVLPNVIGMARADTLAAVYGQPYPVINADIDADEPTAYATLFHHLWGRGWTLIYVEQDMVPAPGDIQSLAECAHDWCAHPYHVGDGRMVYGLGFCKFSAHLQRELPLAAYNGACDPRRGYGYAQYTGLNENVTRHLERLGVRMHRHPEPVAHLHYPTPQDTPDA